MAEKFQNDQKVIDRTANPCQNELSLEEYHNRLNAREDAESKRGGLCRPTPAQVWAQKRGLSAFWP